MLTLSYAAVYCLELSCSTMLLISLRYERAAAQDYRRRLILRRDFFAMFR